MIPRVRSLALSGVLVLSICCVALSSSCARVTPEGSLETNAASVEQRGELRVVLVGIVDYKSGARLRLIDDTVIQMDAILERMGYVGLVVYRMHKGGSVMVLPTAARDDQGNEIPLSEVLRLWRGRFGERNGVLLECNTWRFDGHVYSVMSNGRQWGF